MYLQFLGVCSCFMDAFILIKEENARNVLALQEHSQKGIDQLACLHFFPYPEIAQEFSPSLFEKGGSVWRYDATASCNHIETSFSGWFGHCP